MGWGKEETCSYLVAVAVAFAFAFAVLLLANRREEDLKKSCRRRCQRERVLASCLHHRDTLDKWTGGTAFVYVLRLFGEHLALASLVHMILCLTLAINVAEQHGKICTATHHELVLTSCFCMSMPPMSW